MHPSLCRSASVALLLVSLFLSSSAEAAKLPDVVVTGEPVAPSPGQPGTGLCVASSVSTDPANDFPQSTSSFIGGMNDFMERTAASRSTSVLRTLLDLSNNNTSGTQASRGDFVDAVSGCPSYGCAFFVNDAVTSFGSRLRGYLNVTADLVNKPLNFGFFTDDAVSLVIFDRNTTQYPVIIRPPQLGAPTWRTTNSVTFQQTGLYPIEVLHAEVSDHAALEMAILDGVFTDFERTASQTPIVSLRDSGFLLVPPEKFFQTETGRPSSSNLDQCNQCNRANANAPGNGGCGLDSGRYCNSAALCAPCDTPRVCGPSCSPCAASTPLCVNDNGTYTCVECVSDTQCTNGHCDPATHTCKGCSDSADCPGGKVCHLPAATCVECDADSQCPSGKVCNLATFTCVECTTNSQCSNGRVCNLSTLTCVDCNDDSQCTNGRCDPASYTCKGCNGDDDCPQTGHCDTRTLTCTGCNDNTDCPDGKVCDVPQGTCVGNTDSPPPGEGCGCAASNTMGGASLLVLLVGLVLSRSRRSAWKSCGSVWSLLTGQE